jgi:hypothetical protein
MSEIIEACIIDQIDGWPAEEKAEWYAYVLENPGLSMEMLWYGWHAAWRSLHTRHATPGYITAPRGCRI